MHDDRLEALRDEALAQIDAVYGAALRMTRNREDAEDLVQDTYVGVLRGLPRHRDGALSRAWLFRILTNAYIDRYRRGQRRPTIVSLDETLTAERSPSPTREADLATRGAVEDVDALLHDTISDELKHAVGALPDNVRETVVLRDVAGLTYREIAAALDVPMGTVMSRLHRGRALLREALLQHPSRATVAHAA